MCKSGCSDSGVQVKSRKGSKLSCPSKISNKPPHHNFSGPSHCIAGQASASRSSKRRANVEPQDEQNQTSACLQNFGEFHFRRHDTLKLRRARKLSMWQHDSACGQVAWHLPNEVSQIDDLSQHARDQSNTQHEPTFSPCCCIMPRELSM